MKNHIIAYSSSVIWSWE